MDETDDDTTGAALVLRLELEAGEPLTGTIGINGSDERLPFHGWIDFMAAISALRSSGGR